MLNTHHRGFTPSGTWFEDTGSARDRGSAQDTGQAVVLAHGVGLDLNMWDAQVASLARRCRVIRFDMLGHGRTPALPRTSTLADYCEQLHDLVDFLKLAPLVLVGFSMGGVITQRFSADYPERVRGIVLMSTVSFGLLRSPRASTVTGTLRMRSIVSIPSTTLPKTA